MRIIVKKGDERRIHEIRKGTELYFFVQSRDVWSDLVLYSHDRYAVEHLFLPFDLKSNYRVLWSWNHCNERRANKKILSCESHHQIIVILSLRNRGICCSREGSLLHGVNTKCCFFIVGLKVQCFVVAISDVLANRSSQFKPCLASSCVHGVMSFERSPCSQCQFNSCGPSIHVYFLLLA